MEKLKFLVTRPNAQLAYFLAPLPLQECAERLESKDGKYFNITTHVRVSPIDADKYTFRMRVQIQTRTTTSVVVVGSLNRQDDTTTEVVISRGESITLDPRAGLLIFGALGILLAYFTHTIISLIFMMVLAVSVAYEEHHKYESTVETIEETLGVRRSRKKAKAG